MNREILIFLAKPHFKPLKICERHGFREAAAVGARTVAYDKPGLVGAVKSFDIFRVDSRLACGDVLIVGKQEERVLAAAAAIDKMEDAPAVQEAALRPQQTIFRKRNTLAG